jgi:cell cycle arrest protein BUB3
MTIPLPSKPHSLSLTATKLVVAMSSRLLYIYSLPFSTDPSQEPWQQRESSLKFMTRAVACMPNDDGYASSPIEGRVAVNWFADA